VRTVVENTYVRQLANDTHDVGSRPRQTQESGDLGRVLLAINCPEHSSYIC
jgi:hypothetical protein